MGHSQLSFLKMHPVKKINKFYTFKKIRTVEPLRREGAKGYIFFQIGTNDLKKNHALTGRLPNLVEGTLFAI